MTKKITKDKEAKVVKDIPKEPEENSKIDELTKVMQEMSETMVMMQKQNEDDRAQDRNLIKGLSVQLEEKKAISEPQAGPGPECQCYKVHMGTALQLQKRDGVDVYEPIPENMEVSHRDTIMFLKYVDTGEYVPDCRSKYTELYAYLGPRRPNESNYSNETAYLCKKHAHTLLAKTPTDALNPNAPNKTKELIEQETSDTVTP